MKITIETPWNEVLHSDLSQPIDLSLPYRNDGPLRAWYQGPVAIGPVRMGDWIGETSLGAPVNFRNIFFNPHAHGTHTESVGHILTDGIPVNEAITNFHYLAWLCSVEPAIANGDSVIGEEQLRKGCTNMPKGIKAFVLRTLPNTGEKAHTDYSNSNPAYLTTDAIRLLINYGIEHLLVDLPSVDKEQDDGRLSAHKLFWDYPDPKGHYRTITEFIFVPDMVKDGLYLLNLQVSPFINDAAPSRPLLFKLVK